MRYGPLASYFKFDVCVLISFSLSSFEQTLSDDELLRMCYKLIKCNACVNFVHRWETTEVHETWGGLLKTPWQRCVPVVFFRAIIPVFTSFNLLLQREQPSVFLLHDEVQQAGAVCFFYSAVNIRSDITFSVTVLSMSNFICKLCAKVMVPSALQNHQDLRNIAFKEKAHHPPSRCSIIYLGDDRCNGLKPHH